MIPTVAEVRRCIACTAFGAPSGTLRPCVGVMSRAG